jgi:hypothetical protein
VLATLLLLVPALSAQSSQEGHFDGTWRVESTPWEVFLTRSGSKITGLVNHCANSMSEVFNGTIEGEIVTFQCKRAADAGGTITFRARIDGDEMTVTWTRDGGVAPGPANTLFRPSAPDHFVAKRVPDGELAATARSPRGSIFYGAVSVRSSNVQATGTLYVPETTDRIRVIVFVDLWGAGIDLEDNADWERLAADNKGALAFARFSSIGPSIDELRGAAVLSADERARIVSPLLQEFARASGHSELVNAPLVWWAHSAADTLEQRFATLYPSRTVGLVYYHAGCSDPANGELRVIPALCLAGGRDASVPTASVEALWKPGRAAGSPLTFAMDREATHGDKAGLERATPLMLAWTAAVISQRLGPVAGTLRAVRTDAPVGARVPLESLSGLNERDNWLPDEATAQAWRTLTAAGR